MHDHFLCEVNFMVNGTLHVHQMATMIGVQRKSPIAWSHNGGFFCYASAQNAIMVLKTTGMEVYYDYGGACYFFSLNSCCRNNIFANIFSLTHYCDCYRRKVAPQ